MKNLILIILLLISNILFAQQDSIKPINSLSTGIGINYYGNTQLNLNLIVHKMF